MRFSNFIFVLLSVCSLSGATRLYLPSTGVCVVDPPENLGTGTWNEVDNVNCRPADTTKLSSAMTNKVEGKATTANVRQLMRQYVSKRLNGAQTVSGTVKGTIRVLESAANDNIDKVSLKLVCIDEFGTTATGTMLAVGDYGPTNEWATSLTNRRIADGDTMTTVNCNDKDRILVEIGYNNTTTGTSITGTMNFGDDSVTDLADDEAGTAANNPFVELINVTLSFLAEPQGPPVGTLATLGAGR